MKNRRNPRLVPYILLDERTKKSNKDSLREAVRTLLGHGYNLEAPDQDHGAKHMPYCLIIFGNIFMLQYHFWGEILDCSKVQYVIIRCYCSSSHPAAQSEPDSVSLERFRIFRAEKTYCVNAGKWYFELEVRRTVISVVISERINF